MMVREFAAPRGGQFDNLAGGTSRLSIATVASWLPDVERAAESEMRLAIAALAIFLCATAPEAAAESSLTKWNNDASLRLPKTPGFEGSFLYRRHSYPREQRRGRRPDTKGKPADPI